MESDDPSRKNKRKNNGKKLTKIFVLYYEEDQHHLINIIFACDCAIITLTGTGDPLVLPGDSLAK